MYVMKLIEVYPRACGGTASGLTTVQYTVGLSPRVRGNRQFPQHRHVSMRSIPACAGEPSELVLHPKYHAVYPRVCGGTLSLNIRDNIGTGLSPRVRGNRSMVGTPGMWSGSIPACAGEPLNVHAGFKIEGVYPRVCGGTWCRRNNVSVVDGLSPRVPGEPGSHWLPYKHQPVYPRVCGGTAMSGTGYAPSTGLSPRVRGNPNWNLYYTGSVGSIPACAGEPRPFAPSPPQRRVYPRVCGGTDNSLEYIRGAYGLSPRVRGNHEEGAVLLDDHGSIPACAGEPHALWSGYPASWVYPRVCGGTAIACLTLMPQIGLSPRVRGNRRGKAKDLAGWGSIPACAGEPAGSAYQQRHRRVYPRVCRGTAKSSSASGYDSGLSPRVRGNLPPGLFETVSRRSIPACAGEP